MKEITFVIKKNLKLLMKWAIAIIIIAGSFKQAGFYTGMGLTLFFIQSELRDVVLREYIKISGRFNLTLRGVLMREIQREEAAKESEERRELLFKGTEN